MSTIGWMLTRMILLRFAGILFVLASFVITLEVFTLVDDILQVRGGNLWAVPEYAWLMLPGTLSTFLPVSALLAILLTLVELTLKNELPAIWAAGVSPLRVVMMLMPVGLLLGGLHFLLNDQIAPRTEPQLAAWGIGEHGRKKLMVGERDPIWLRSGDDIMRAGASNRDRNRSWRRAPRSRATAAGCSTMSPCITPTRRCRTASTNSSIPAQCARRRRGCVRATRRR
jgi:lipopolysaccharide export system permease protein